MTDRQQTAKTTNVLEIWKMYLWKGYAFAHTTNTLSIYIKIIKDLCLKAIEMVVYCRVWAQEVNWAILQLL